MNPDQIQPGPAPIGSESLQPPLPPQPPNPATHSGTPSTAYAPATEAAQSSAPSSAQQQTYTPSAPMSPTEAPQSYNQTAYPDSNQSAQPSYNPPSPAQSAPQQVQSSSLNEYEFIVHPDQQTPKSKLSLPSFGGGGLASKLIPIIAIGVVVMILLWIVALVFSRGGSNIDNAVSLVQSQQEVTRVTELAQRDASDQALKNASATAHATLASQQQQWILFLSTEGRKVEEKELALKTNAEIDSSLEEAKTEGTFDQTYQEILRELLQAYTAQVEQAFAQASETAERELLSAHYQQTELLLQQLPEQTNQ